MSIKAGSLVKCVKVDPDEHLKLDTIYTCCGVQDGLIKLITAKGGEHWYPAEFVRDLFGPQGD